MEKAGIAVVGALILVILVVGWVNRSSGEERPGGAESDRFAEDARDLEKTSPGSGRDDRDDRDRIGGGGGARPEVGRDTIDPGGSGERVVLDDPPKPTKDEPVPGPDPEIVGDEPPRPGPSASREHVVASGDTFSSLAKRYFDDEALHGLITDANPDVDPRRLRVGTKLVIPAAGAAPASRGEPEARLAKKTTRRPSFIPDAYVNRYADERPASVREGAGDAAGGRRSYTVKAGDTLGGIALATLGSTRKARAIFEANRDLMKTPDTLRVGWVLKIPTDD